MKTPMFVCLALTRAPQFLVMVGASEFLPIYLENQFVLTATKATILSGKFAAQCTNLEIFM